MEQKWFEMTEVRKRRFDNAVWIPLRAAENNETGEFGSLGYMSEYFAVGSLAVPLRKRQSVEKLGWMDLGPIHDHGGYMHGTWPARGGRTRARYVATGEFEDERKGCVPLVLSQRGNSAERSVWHIHPDFVITLGLKREGNVWVAMDEDYIEVVRLKLDEDGSPRLMEVRADHLKDYLCARRMALFVSWYRHRLEIVEAEPHFKWPTPDGLYKDGERWEGRITAIHEGGEPFGGSMAVMHVTRTNLDFEEDVPRIGISDESATSSFTRQLSERRRLYRIDGEVWRNEWVEPGARSTRIRRDDPDPPIAFVVDPDGKKQVAKTLIDSGRWLWFKPDLIPALLAHRGGALEWYTRETGGVKGSPDYNVHFGVNSLGLVNAYAKDVALLPEWLQRIWAGFNVSPEGKVSAELFSAQGQGVPARTQAPEQYLGVGIRFLNESFEQRFGIPLFHHDTPDGLKLCHRFRAINAPGLYGLAKDLVRAVVENIDTSALHKIVAPPKKEKWGSLKSLEQVLATVVGKKNAYIALGPLHGIYNLRLADAHISSNDLDEAYALARVDRALPFVMQGRDLLIVCVTCVHLIAEAFEELARESQSSGGVP
jgi:hypothetical protein